MIGGAQDWLREHGERMWVDRSFWPSSHGKPVFVGKEYVMKSEPFWLFPFEAAVTIASRVYLE